MRPQTIVTIIATTLVFISFATITSYILNVGMGKIIPQSVRFCLTVTMAIFLVKGSNVARWIAVVLLGLGSVGSLIYSIPKIGANPSLALVAVIGIAYLVCTILLLVPPGSRHFSKSKID